MEKRIIFNLDGKRHLFFRKARESYGFDNWKSFYLKLNIPRSLFDKYRFGSISIPIRLFDKLNKNLTDEFSSAISKKISFIDGNLGQIKGGREAYKINKKIFEKGRRIGLKKIVKINKISDNSILTPDLCYFIGLFIGDGFANKYRSSYLIQFVGHKDYEKIFYEDFFSKLVFKIFSLKSKIILEKKVNAVRLNIHSKELIQLLNERFKIPLGKKFDKVRIPEEILESTSSNISACLAGLFDAEGCVFIDKRKIYSKEYPRVVFHINNKYLTKQIYDILMKDGIKVSNSSNFEMLNIYGKKNILLFLEKIKLQNPKHLSKLKLAKLI